jgi:hypothetical protein
MQSNDVLHSLNARWIELMCRGKYEEAWRVSDSAQLARAGIDCSSWPRHQQFIWSGAPLRDRHVLVRCYHGLGDTIQYLRFLPTLKRIAREVTLWVQPALIPLLRLTEGVHRVMPLHDGAPDVSYEVDIEISELMHVLRVTPDTLASHVPYIRGRDIARPRHRSKRHVGIVWRAGEWNDSRSIPCASLERLGRIADVKWCVLQRGPALAGWRHPFGRVPAIENMADEARVMAELDLIVTVDTCSAHLAGALGMPTWLLLPHEADWRWMHERDDTPWYPTMRLMRQPSAGNWAAVLNRVERNLTERLTQ